MTESDDPESLQYLRRLEIELSAVRREIAILRYDLSGKDLLTVGEASHYCGVSERNFRKRATEYGFPSG